MQELLEIGDLKKARCLLHPVRVQALHYLSKSRSCRELSELMNITQQRLNHHLRELKKGRLIRVVKTRRKGNLLEAVYQRTSKAYWFSPRLAVPGNRQDREARDQLSLHNLLVLAEGLQDDVAGLLCRSGRAEIPSMAFDAEVVLDDEEQRQAFIHDVLRAFHAVAEKYQSGVTRGGGKRFKVVVCSYPKSEGENT